MRRVRDRVHRGGGAGAKVPGHGAGLRGGDLLTPELQVGLIILVGFLAIVCFMVWAFKQIKDMEGRNGHH